jgi:ABC-type dipeptide/oligopeptide/nickel transport system permease component
MDKMLTSKGIKQFLSYFGVGGVSALVEWAVFSLLEYLLDMPYLLATILAFIFSTTTNWFLGRTFTFKESAYKDKKGKEIFLVFLVSAIGLGFNLLLMYLFAIRLGWFPVISKGVSLQSVALPAFTLAIAMSAKYLRQVRATVLDELSKDYVLGAKARGVPFSTTMMKSVMKASLVTIITLLTLSIGSLLGGTAIVESIFMWDGVGKMAVDAINMRDYPIIQAYVMWMAIIYVVVNLITDLSYRYLDPRIRLGGIEQ